MPRGRTKAQGSEFGETRTERKERTLVSLPKATHLSASAQTGDMEMTTYKINDRITCTNLGKKNRFADCLKIGASYIVVKFYPEIRQGAFVQSAEILMRNERGEEGKFPAYVFE